jgi:hypothetical protein
MYLHVDTDDSMGRLPREDRGGTNLDPSFNTTVPAANPTRNDAMDASSNGDSGDCTCDMHWLVDAFAPIGLKQLNAKAAMLVRLDNKYVVREVILRRALTELAKHFDILEIDGKRDFIYDTCYFDDPNNSSYFDHHRGRRQRFKVRVRKYTDAQLCFVEIKLKDKRGVTIKKRLDYAVEKYGTLDDSAWKHIVSAYSELYGREFTYTLAPVVEMRYKRITLVAKSGGERMTIDCKLVFTGDGRSHCIDDDVFIIETKSSKGNGIADKILRSLHQHPTKRCSKYCVARAALQGVRRHNKFLPALRKLNVLPKATVPTMPVAPRPSAAPVSPSSPVYMAQEKPI